MGMVIKQYDILLINLDPTVGHEIKKVRPCVIISPDELNRNIETVIIAPMTTRGHAFPTRVPVRFKAKDGWIVLDQIRTVDRKRLVKKVGKLDDETAREVKAMIQEMLVD
jgi:mRNA interferase MazF